MLKYSDYAYEVYKEKSFTKASEKLFVSQPALSAVIKKLENELGAQIFDRSGKEIKLTDIGEKYINAIEEIQSIERNLKREIDDLQKLKKGSITLGSTMFVSSCLLPDVLRPFQNAYPQVEINILVEQSSELEHLLEKGSVDFIIDNTLQKSNLYEYEPVMKERILIAVPKDFAVNDELKRFAISYNDLKGNENWHENQPKVDVSLFKNEKFILLKQGNKMRQITNKIFKESGFFPFVAQEFDHLSTSLSFTESRFGISFVTDTFLKHEKELKDVVFYLPKTPQIKRTLYVISKKNKYKTFATKELISHITKTLNKK